MSPEKEEWMPVAGYEDRYEVSNFGRVWSIGKSIFMKCFQSPTGYWRVELMRLGIGKTFYVHRLVAGLFVLNPNDKPQVNHIDADKTNNFWENLEWVTHRENMKHASDMKLIPGSPGDKNPNSKLSWETVFKIRAKYALGGISCAKLSREHNTSASNVQSIVNKTTWKTDG